MYVYIYEAVASKRSRSHFIPEKYKRVQSLKLHFLQNSPFVHVYTSSSDCKSVRNISGSKFMKAFSAFPSHSWCQQNHKVENHNADFSWGNKYKPDGARSGEYGGCLSVGTFFYDKKYLTKTDWCAGAVRWRRNQLLFLHFGGRLLQTASPRRRTNLWDRNFPHATTSGNYTSEFRERFEATLHMKYRNWAITSTATMRNPQVMPMLHKSNVGLYIICIQ